MRFFPDRPDVLVKGRWYFCPPGAKVLPFHHSFTSMVWDPDKDVPPPIVGEVQKLRTWTNGQPNSRFTGKHWCGSPDQWVNGVPYADHVTLALDCAGVPKCCGLPAVQCAMLGLTAASKVLNTVRAYLGLTATARFGRPPSAYLGLTATARFGRPPSAYLGLTATARFAGPRAYLGLTARASVSLRARAYVGLLGDSETVNPEDHFRTALLGLYGIAARQDGDKSYHAFLGLTAHAVVS